MISLLLFSLAAILNSFMDKWNQKYIQLPKLTQNIINPNWFSFNPLAKWMCGKRSYGRAYNILFLKLEIKTKWLTDNCNDGWHLFKSLKVILYALSAITFNSNILLDKHWWNYFIVISLYGLAWNLPFNLFYNYKSTKTKNK